MKVKRGAGGSVYVGLREACVRNILLLAEAASGRLGRASQTANERFLHPGAAISLPSGWGRGTCRPQVDLFPQRPLHGCLGDTGSASTTRALRPRFPPSQNCPL